MKKSIFYILACLSLVFSSCTSEVDDVFNKQSAIRIQETLKADQDILCAAPNGWVMQYYPYADADNSSHTNYGGYNLLMQFTQDGHVTIANEIYQPEDKATSTYHLEQSEGAVLSFDTYNDLFHFFSDPANEFGIGPKGIGFEGDLEFRIKSASAEKVVLEGKKHHSTIVMTPLPADKTWEQYLTNIHTEADNIAFASYNYVVGKDQYAVASNYNVFSITYLNEDSIAEKAVVPYIVTETGISLYKELTIGGITVKDFTYDAETYRLVADGNSDVFFQGVVKPFNEVLTSGDASWYLTYANCCPAAQAYIDDMNNAVSVEGETINYIYIESNVFYFQSGRYWGGFELKVDKEGEDIVTLSVTDFGGTDTTKGNASYYLGNYESTGFGSALNLFDGKFKIEGNDLRNPTVLTLTSVDDPSYVLILQNTAAGVK